MKLRMSAGLFSLVAAANTAAAAATTITLNGAPLQLDVTPLVQAGRVFVPLRGVFEALGASVVYQNGTINATRGGSTVSLHIGSSTALVSGTQQTLDTPPFISGATTYVPLRFVAQALGASVAYDNTSGSVAIVQRGQRDRAVQPRYSDIALRDTSPRNGDALHENQPEISADFSQPVDPNLVRVSLDGLDISNLTTRSPRGIVFEPASPLQAMGHQVVVSGRDAADRSFSLHWSFATGVALERDELRIDGLHDGADVPRTFNVTGMTFPHARIHVSCGAIGHIRDGIERGSFDADTLADEHGRFSQNVIANAPPGGDVTLLVRAATPGNERVVERLRHLHVGSY